MKRIAIALCAALLVCMSLSALPAVGAAGTLKASVSSASGAVGESVTLNVNITANPGVAGFWLELTYDKTKLKLTGVSGGAFSGTTLPDPASATQNISFLTADTKNTTATGKVASLTFQILSGASGSLSVTLRNLEVKDKDLQSVGFSVSAGKITVKAASSSKPTSSASSKPVSSAASSKPASSAASSKPVSSAVSSAPASSAAEPVSEPDVTSQEEPDEPQESTPQESSLPAAADTQPELPQGGNTAPLVAVILLGLAGAGCIAAAVVLACKRKKER